MSTVKATNSRDLAMLATVWTPISECKPGNVVWLNRKVRGLGGSDCLIVLTSEVIVEGDQAFFEHVDLTRGPESGKWSACTSADAVFERVILPD